MTRPARPSAPSPAVALFLATGAARPEGVRTAPGLAGISSCLRAAGPLRSGRAASAVCLWGVRAARGRIASALRDPSSGGRTRGLGTPAARRPAPPHACERRRRPVLRQSGRPVDPASSSQSHHSQLFLVAPALCEEKLYPNRTLRDPFSARPARSGSLLLAPWLLFPARFSTHSRLLLSAGC